MYCNLLTVEVNLVILIVFSGCVGTPLGMEHGHIKDRDIAASSTFDYHSVGPHMGRARQDRKGGAWCPAHTISRGVREWIEINLHMDYRITSTETMGRFGGGQGQEFAETYQVEYWRESLGGWHLYTNTTGHDVLAGNTNTYLAHKQDLHPPIVASRVRFLPVSVSIPCDHVYPVSYSVTGTPQDYLYEGGGVWLSSH